MESSYALNQIQKCFFCHETSTNLFQFSCNHKICLVCIYRRVFCYNITDFSTQEKVTIKCRCEQGEMEKNLDEMIEILTKKTELDKAKEEAIKNTIDFPRCQNHPSNYINYYCVQCYEKVCKICAKSNESIHLPHRVVPESRLLKNICSNIKEIPMSFKERELFENNFERLGQKIKEVTEKNYNNTMQQIGELINSLNVFKKRYDEEYKKELSRGVKTFKMYKLFYLNYYYDKGLCDAVSNDVNLLRFVNNIGYELVNTELKHDSKITQKILDLKVEAENLRKMAETSLQVSFSFNEVKRDYKCDDVLMKAHSSYISGLLQAKDERLISGGTDFKIKAWEEGDSTFTNVMTIEQMTGKISNLLQLKDGRLVSTADDNVTIKIWVVDLKSYTIQQTLSGHSQNITSITQLKDERLVSGSMDNSIIVWKENSSHSFELSQKLVDGDYPVTVVYGLFDNRFASGTLDHNLKIWKEGTDFTDKNFSCIQTFSANKYPIKIICQIKEDGQLITAFGEKSTSIVRWREMNPNSFEPVQKISEHKSEITSIIQLLDRRIATSSRDHTIRLYKFNDNKRPELVLSEVISDFDHGIFNLIQLRDGRIGGSTSDLKIVLWRNRNDMY